MLRRRKARITPNEPSNGGAGALDADFPRAAEKPRAREQAGGRDPVSVEIPVPDSRRAAFVILEDRRIEREPDERGAKQNDADQAQTAMRHPMEEPEESEALPGPAERDPFALKLERKNQTNEKQERPTLPGEPGIAARGIGPIKFQQRPHADRGRNAQRRLAAAPSIR